MLRNCRLPLVIDIKRHSLEDGPGIRSVVFFKGCPLNCTFCQNPETQDPRAEIAFYERKCIQCGKCMDICGQKAIDLNFAGRIHREKCVRCGVCAKVCPSGGLRLLGTYHPVDTLYEILLRDAAFYSHSGGGVTLSGGESALYPDYLEALAKRLKARNIHITLETSGYFEYETFKYRILPYLDLIYFDIKFADPEIHERYTGKTNERIFNNFRRLLKERGIEVHPRVPLIPGMTATRENLSAIVDFLYDAGANNVSLLPYNPMGMEMATSLGIARPSLPEGFMKPDEEREIYSLFQGLIKERECLTLQEN
jgi:pyruvate formate lyase activating enzyme